MNAKVSGETTLRRMWLLAGVAVILGLVGGGAAVGLFKLIGLITHLTLLHNVGFDLPTLRGFHPSWWLIPTAIGGGLVVALFAKWAPVIRGHGIPESLEAILSRDSKIRPRAAVAKPLSAAVTIGTGGPFGAEGPIIVTGGSIGSLIGQALAVSPAERKIMLATGAAAGMAATFNTPVAAVILAIELVLFERSLRTIVPLSIACAIAAGIHIVAFGSEPLFFVAATLHVSMAHLPLFVVVGLASGVLAVILNKGLFAMEAAFRRLPIKIFWWPAIGALGFAVIGLFVPRTLSMGYSAIEDTLNGHFALTALAVLFGAKLLSWWIALGSQTSGGTLAPMFLVGATMGALLGDAVNEVWPALHVSPAAFALVAMGATFGAATKAVFASAVFAVEVTGQYQMAIPLLIGVAVAELVAEAFLTDRLMTEKLSHRGYRVDFRTEVGALRMRVAGQVMRKPVVLQADLPVSEARARLAAGSLTWLAVADGDGRYLGCVSAAGLAGMGGDGTQAVGPFANPAAPVASADDYLSSVLNRLTVCHVDALPVVQGDRVVGQIGRADIAAERHRHVTVLETRQAGWLTGLPGRRHPGPRGGRHLTSRHAVTARPGSAPAGRTGSVSRGRVARRGADAAVPTAVDAAEPRRPVGDAVVAVTGAHPMGSAGMLVTADGNAISGGKIVMHSPINAAALAADGAKSTVRNGFSGDWTASMTQQPPVVDQRAGLSGTGAAAALAKPQAPARGGESGTRPTTEARPHRSGARVPDHGGRSGTQVVPAPVRTTPLAGQFALSDRSRVVVAWRSSAALPVAEQLASWLRPATGLSLRVSEGRSYRDDIELRLGAPTDLPSDQADEGYVIDIGWSGAKLTAVTVHGLYNGAQTLRQLLPVWAASRAPVPGPWVIPAVRIVDYPRYSYRGLMLDVAGHLLSPDAVMELVDQAAAYKLNVLHLRLSAAQALHLAGDEPPGGPAVDSRGLSARGLSAPDISARGLSARSLSAPDISARGLSARSFSARDFTARDAASAGNREAADGQSRWTREQFQRIVAHAGERFMTVMPEVDSPGYDDPNRWAICARVVGRLCEMSSAPYYHLGGGGLPSWTKPGSRYAAFVDAQAGLVNGLGKIAMGWGDLTRAADLMPGSVAEYWHTDSGSQPATVAASSAVAKGLKLVMAPASHAYLDQKYPDASLGQSWARESGSGVDDFYNWDPGEYVDGVTDADILGTEAVLWSTAVPSAAAAEFLAFPRLLATAELAWSPKAERSEGSAAYPDFVMRLAAQGARLGLAGTTFHPSPKVPWRLDLAAVATRRTGRGISGPLAVLSAPGRDADMLSTTIDWGDGLVQRGTLERIGPPGPAQIRCAGGVYHVLGNHDYHKSGTYRVTVTVGAPAADPVSATFVVRAGRLSRRSSGHGARG